MADMPGTSEIRRTIDSHKQAESVPRCLGYRSTVATYQSFTTVFLSDFQKFRCYYVQSFLPRDLLEATICPAQGIL
jgi:hypothetical protein